jgi:hypothetical protein
MSFYVRYQEGFRCAIVGKPDSEISECLHLSVFDKIEGIQRVLSHKEQKYYCLKICCDLHRADNSFVDLAALWEIFNKH